MQISDRRIADLSPAFRTSVRLMMLDLEAEGLEPVVIEGRRSAARQAKLYAHGRTSAGPIVTWTTCSRHQTGQAVDIWWLVNGHASCTVPAAWWVRLGHAARKHGLAWGGDWTHRDYAHVEAKEA